MARPVGIAHLSRKGFPVLTQYTMIQEMKERTKGRKGRKTITPSTLNITCNLAAFFDSVFPTHEAISVLRVEPMFDPSTMTAAISKGSQPLRQMVSVNAMEALDDWINAVRIIPIDKKSIIDNKPWFPRSEIKYIRSGCLWRSGTTSFRNWRARSRIEKPIAVSAQCLYFPFFIKRKGIARAIKGRQIRNRLYSNPRMVTIQIVTELPTLDPMMIPAAAVRLMIPALTKLMVITVITELDCRAAVVKKPVRKEETLFCVTFCKESLNWMLAIRCTPSLMTFMPKIKSARAPKIWSMPYQPISTIYLITKKENNRAGASFTV